MMIILFPFASDCLNVGLRPTLGQWWAKSAGCLVMMFLRKDIDEEMFPPEKLSIPLRGLEPT